MSRDYESTDEAGARHLAEDDAEPDDDTPTPEEAAADWQPAIGRASHIPNDADTLEEAIQVIQRAFSLVNRLPHDHRAETWAAAQRALNLAYVALRKESQVD